ncbi:hypothetical protein M0804_004303 [Polistes exclamans]|nr:hypothetical protein M0804_004303 [Polistes exclamans]
MSEDEDDLQRMLYKFEYTSGNLHMTISVEKAELITISKESRRIKSKHHEQQRPRGEDKRPSNQSLHNLRIP